MCSSELLIFLEKKKSEDSESLDRDFHQALLGAWYLLLVEMPPVLHHRLTAVWEV